MPKRQHSDDNLSDVMRRLEIAKRFHVRFVEEVYLYLERNRGACELIEGVSEAPPAAKRQRSRSF